MNCVGCGASCATKNPNRPRKGAKRFKDALYCAVCWNEQFVLRAITIPVAMPVDNTWDEFYKVLHEAWASTTACCTWMVTELYGTDVKRHGQEKLPPMKNVYLYPAARQRFPTLPSQSVTAIEQAVKSKYRKTRLDVIWRAAASLPTYRYPTPFPIHNQSWSIELDAGKPVVSARLGDKRWSIRLKAGRKNFARQLLAVKQIVAGDALRGEMALYRHHDGTVLCKMVAWLPRPEQSAQQSGIMFVRTGTDHFITAQFSKDATDEAWYLNADHVRRWVHEYERLRQRLHEDRKAEQRPVPSFATRQAIIVEKQRRRMKSAVNDTAAQVVNYAKRRHAESLEYTDSARIHESFPWFQLRERIKTKCDEYNIRFTHGER